MRLKCLNQFAALGMAALLTSCVTRNNDLSSVSGTLTSPDSCIVVKIYMNDKQETEYNVLYKDREVLVGSKLGVVMEDAGFSAGLKLVSVSGVEEVSDNYSMLHGKKKDISYRANQKVFHFRNRNGLKMDIIFRASDDGIAFRYLFPGRSGETKTIVSEATTYSFPDSTRTWIQPIAAAKSGWMRSNPSYEEHYEQDVDIRNLVHSEPGWVYPALFNSKGIWICITETAPYRDYCGSRLKHIDGSSDFSVGFPSHLETLNEKDGALPNSTLPWSSPWRILAISESPGGMIESTLGTDLARPAVTGDISYVKPGRASWSWVMLKDDSVVYNVQKRFIDYSAAMGWEYCLIDVNWNRNIGYDNIRTLADYGAGKNVGLILWYNSAGKWNDTPYEPRDMMLTAESREKEFARLKEIGIKGVKVDFFGGDGQDVMAYYNDIFECAAKYGIMVNTHGCTLPRGWQRTFPNLVTMEAIKGEEFVTFEQINADRQPAHCCVIPFTRNAFDPMDFTPVVFSEIPWIKRRTTNSFELALSVLFLSGIQHYAETDTGMKIAPDFMRQYLIEIPVAWDETKFIDGYPGKLVIIARRTGNTWYVAGINGEQTPKNVPIDLSFTNAKYGELISDKTDRETQRENITLPEDNKYNVRFLPYGGFVMKLTRQSVAMTMITY